MDTRSGAVLVTRQVGRPGSGTFQVGNPVVVDDRIGRVFVMHMSPLLALAIGEPARKATFRPAARSTGGGAWGKEQGRQEPGERSLDRVGIVHYH